MSKVWSWVGGIVVGLCIIGRFDGTGEPSAGPTGSPEAP